MKSDDVQEVLRLAEDIDAMTAGLGGADTVREWEIQGFRAELDGDDASAERALEKVRALVAHHEAASELLRTFGVALERRNMPLAHAAHAGVLDLVRGALAAELTTTPREEEEDDEAADEGG